MREQIRIEYCVNIFVNIDISGVPGVGKTLSTMRTISKIKKHTHHSKATFKYINAFKLRTPKGIYKALN